MQRGGDVRRRGRQVAPYLAQLAVGDAEVPGGVADVVAEAVEEPFEVAARVVGGRQAVVGFGVAAVGTGGRCGRRRCGGRARGECGVGGAGGVGAPGAAGAAWGAGGGEAGGWPNWPSSRVSSASPSRSPLCQSPPFACDCTCSCTCRAIRCISSRAVSIASRAASRAALAWRRASRASSLARRLSSFARLVCSFHCRWASPSPCRPAPGWPSGPVRACWAAARTSRRRSPAAPRTSSRISAASEETDSRISASRPAISSAREASSARPSAVRAYTLRPPSVEWVTRPSCSSLASRG